MKGVSMFRQQQINVPILGIVENMAYFTQKSLILLAATHFKIEGGFSP